MATRDPSAESWSDVTSPGSTPPTVAGRESSPGPTTTTDCRPPAVRTVHAPVGPHDGRVNDVPVSRLRSSPVMLPTTTSAPPDVWRTPASAVAVRSTATR